VVGFGGEVDGTIDEDCKVGDDVLVGVAVEFPRAGGHTHQCSVSANREGWVDRTYRSHCSVMPLLH